jgi:hypothetical protein
MLAFPKSLRRRKFSAVGVMLATTERQLLNAEAQGTERTQGNGNGFLERPRVEQVECVAI